MTFPTNPHGYYSRKLSIRHCALNTAVSFFHGLDQIACSYRPSPYPHCCLFAAFLLLPHITQQPWIDLHQQSSSQLVCTYPPPVGFLSPMSYRTAFEGDPYRHQITRFFVPSLRQFSNMMDTENTDMLLSC